MTRSARRLPGIARAARATTRRKFVSALAGGLDVLACFKGDHSLDYEEICALTGLGRSSVRRLIYTLTELGYLIHLPEASKYRLGASVLTLSSGALERYQIRNLAAPLMQELAEATGTSVALGTRDGLSIVCIEVKRSSAAPLVLNTEVGTRLPLATSAIGRAYLAICNEQEYEDLIAQIGRLEAAPECGLRRQLDLSLATYEILGACGSFGEWQPDVNGIAVGLRAGSGLPAMSINCGAPAINVSPEFLLDEVRPQLIEVVRRLEESLGRDHRQRDDPGREYSLRE